MPGACAVFDVDARVADLAGDVRLRLVGLSRREAEAALLVARGLLVQDVARQMNVSAGTVKTLLARGRAKLHCRSARDLARLLIMTGVIRPEDLEPPRPEVDDVSTIGR